MPSDKSDKAELPCFGPNGAVLNSAHRGGEEKSKVNSQNSDHSIKHVERFADRQPLGPSRFSWIKLTSKYSAIIAVLALTASYFGTIYWRE